MAVGLTACAPNPNALSAEQFGDAWPFTVPSGTLRCVRVSSYGNRPLVTLDTRDGREFGVNGAAIGFGFPRIQDITKPDRLADLQPLIARGLKICEAER